METQQAEAEQGTEGQEAEPETRSLRLDGPGEAPDAQDQEEKSSKEAPEGKPKGSAPEDDFSLDDLEPKSEEDEDDGDLPKDGEEDEPENKKPLMDTAKMKRRLDKVEKGRQKRIDSVIAENKALKDR